MPDDETAFFFVPFMILTSFGSPSMYLLMASDFDLLPLTASGPAEEVNGLRALPVWLDKAAVIGLLADARIQEAAQGELPDDFLVET